MSSSTSRVSIDSLTSPQTPVRPVSEYPFPRYDSSQRRPGSAGRFQPRRGSTASSITSIGGSLDTAANSWSHGVHEVSQNAISTLLQPPIVRTGLQPFSSPAFNAHKAPTARDIAPVALTNIPLVDPTEFQAYLTQVGSLYDALQRARETEDDGSKLLRRGSTVDDFADLLEGTHKSKRPLLSRQASLASLASLTPLESPSPRRRLSGGISKKASQAPPPLSTIPVVYFDDEFRLENPRTFDVVSERSEVIKPSPGSPEERRGSNGTAAGPRKALATNAILQEKLSWYMDTIEIHLISSISTASTSFFAALGSLRELHGEAAESVRRIKVLREELEALDDEMAVGGLDIVTKRRRRENLKQLANAMEQLRLVAKGIGRCEALVDDGEIENALDAMDALESLIAGEQSETEASILGLEKLKHLRNLSESTALQGLNSDLDTLRLRIGNAYEVKFMSTLVGDLRQHIETAPPHDTLQRWSDASQRSRGQNRASMAAPLYLTMAKDLRSDLQSTLKGLHRAHHIILATTAYREVVLKEVKAIIKQPLPSSNDDDNESMMSASTSGGSRKLNQQEKSSILARNLRALEPEAAEEMLSSMYIGLGETMRRLGTQVRMMLDITSTIDDPASALSPRSPKSPKSPPRSPNMAAIDELVMPGGASQPSSREIQEEMHQTLDISNLLGQAVDIAQNQIVKILRVRNEQSVQQPLTLFLRYFTLNLLFANECEAVSGRSGTSLKNLVNNQIKEFTKQMGDTQQQKLAQGMDADTWSAKDFSEADNVCLSRILEASDRNPEDWTVGRKIWLPYEEPYLEGSVTTNGNATKDKARPATIESESFVLPESAILCLRGIEPYLQLITGIPSIATDVATSLMSYLQLFNSRCTQLILGAGATRTVGLKNITAKHLALASQALSFIATLIPHIREFIRRHTSTSGGLMGEFDKIKRLYQEHQGSISDKLVEIMSGRSTIAIRNMKATDWDSAPASDGVNAYMETLTKETITLHKVLTRHLPDTSMLMIMAPVFKSYKEQWGKAYSEAVVETEEGKARMLTDVAHFSSRLSKIDPNEGDAAVGHYLQELVSNKPVKQPEPVRLPEPELPPVPTIAASGASESATTSALPPPTPSESPSIKEELGSAKEEKEVETKEENEDTDEPPPTPSKEAPLAAETAAPSSEGKAVS